MDFFCTLSSSILFWTQYVQYALKSHLMMAALLLSPFTFFLIFFVYSSVRTLLHCVPQPPFRFHAYCAPLIKSVFLSLPLSLLFLFLTSQLIYWVPPQPRHMDQWALEFIRLHRTPEILPQDYHRYIESNLLLLGPSASPSDPDHHPVRARFYQPDLALQIQASFLACFTFDEWKRQPSPPPLSSSSAMGVFFDLQDRLTPFEETCWERSTRPYSLFHTL